MLFVSAMARDAICTKQGFQSDSSIFVLPQPLGHESGDLFWLFIGGKVAGVGQQMELATAGRGANGFHLGSGHACIFAAGDGQDGNRESGYRGQRVGPRGQTLPEARGAYLVELAKRFGSTTA